MSSQQHRPATDLTAGSELETTTDVGSGVEEGPEGSNSEQAEAIRTEEGTAAGLANYQATLGTWLGSELYAEVASHLTLDKLGDYADRGLTGALKGLVGVLNDVDGEVNESAVENFANALSDAYATSASEWVKGDGKDLATTLADWVDANPELLVTIALLAAAGAIAADLDIPELKAKMGITKNLSAEVEAKLGSLRSIALEKITAKLSWKSGPLIAAIRMERDDEGQVSTTASAQLGDKERHLKVEGEFEGNDLKVIGVSGLYKTDETTVEGRVVKKRDKKPSLGVDLTYGDEDMRVTNGIEWDGNSEILTLRDARKFMLNDNASLNTSLETNTEGETTAGLGLETETGVNGLTASGSLDGGLNGYDLTDDWKAAAGLRYSKNDLNAELSASLSGLGGLGIEGSAEKHFSESWSGGLDANYSLSDGRLLEVGGFFGYRDPNEFSTYLASYRHNTTADSHEVSLLMEEKLGSIYTRINNEFTLSGAGMDYSGSAHGAHFINDDWALMAGARYELGPNGTHEFTPEAGVQFKGVPLMIGYAMEAEAITIGISIPFGRSR
jgi:hypothetical protein